MKIIEIKKEIVTIIYKKFKIMLSTKQQLINHVMNKKHASS